MRDRARGADRSCRITGPAILLMVLSMSVLSLPAATAAGAGADVSGVARVGSETGTHAAVQPAGGGAAMSLDVQGAEIRTVLRSIAEFGRVNIIPDNEVDGTVNIRLTDIPWRQALDIVCESTGLVAVDRRQDVIRVAMRKVIMDEELERNSAAKKREELVPLQTSIFQVNYANAEDMKKSVQFALSPRGSAEVDSRTNSVLVTDVPDRITQIGEMIRGLDSETLQVDIVAKLVDMDVSYARELGISWNLDNLHSTKQRISGSVAHKTEIADATTELKFGMVRNWANIDATIQAMERNNTANIISNPSITTVNNRTARILVGKEIPLIVLDQAGNPITQLKKVGITLEVTPYINSENRVTMDIHPEVSDLSSQATVQGGIIFSTSEADTRVMVGDGETAVIGGLISSSETVFDTGVPVLRKIPVLGHLFGSSDKRTGRRELMIFVTPRIVRGMATMVKPE
jgi:type IV pilus assembly protein PilQ